MQQNVGVRKEDDRRAKNGMLLGAEGACGPSAPDIVTQIVFTRNTDDAGALLDVEPLLLQHIRTYIHRNSTQCWVQTAVQIGATARMRSGLLMHEARQKQARLAQLRPPGSFSVAGT
eukprot:m.485544 g.485544  ORF g.485544 m.485544 type:complete len:117 (-) comp57208_c0_seq9:11-361(-)